MKAFLEKIGLALTILICLPFFVSCTGSENEQYVKTNSEKISVNDNINNMANLHSIALDCAVEIAEEYRMSTTNLTTEQLYYVVTESAVLNGVKKYVNQKENRTLSSTEENTLKKEVNNYWNDSSTRNLINKLSTESAINSLNPTTGSADLKIFYKNLNINSVAQRYFNRMLSAINYSNYETNLDQLYIEVWSRSDISENEKQGILTVIAATKDSYKYWNTNFNKTRVSGVTKTIIISDALGAIRGLWRGIGRSAGALVFGPGGSVLTIGGSVIVGAASSSIKSGIVAGLIRLF